MKRGDVFAAVLPGALGKPRPVVVAQSDGVAESFPTVTVLPLTGTLESAPLYRITVEPTEGNGLRKICQVQVDKATSIPRGKFGAHIGRLDERTMIKVNRNLALWLGLVI